MGLVDITKGERLTHPTEEGQWVEIRPLFGWEIDEAQEVKLKRMLALWGDSLMDTARRNDGGEPQDDTLFSRVQRYDAGTLLKYAVVAWSYSEPVTSENVARLDALTREWLVEEVVRRNTRPRGKVKSGSVS